MPDVVGKRLAVSSFGHEVLGFLTPSICSSVVTIIANFVTTLRK